MRQETFDQARTIVVWRAKRAGKGIEVMTPARAYPLSRTEARELMCSLQRALSDGSDAGPPHRRAPARAERWGVMARYYRCIGRSNDSLGELDAADVLEASPALAAYRYAQTAADDGCFDGRSEVTVLVDGTEYVFDVDPTWRVVQRQRKRSGL